MNRPAHILAAMFQGGGNIPLLMPVMARLVERGHILRILAGPGVRRSRLPISESLIRRSRRPVQRSYNSGARPPSARRTATTQGIDRWMGAEAIRDHHPRGARRSMGRCLGWNVTAELHESPPISLSPITSYSVHSPPRRPASSVGRANACRCRTALSGVPPYGPGGAKSGTTWKTPRRNRSPHSEIDCIAATDRHS